MADRTLSSCMWILVLGMCVSLVVATDCEKECALCVYRLLEQQSGFSILACSLECEGGLDSQKIRLCRDFLLDQENDITTNADPLQTQDQDPVVSLTADKDAKLPEHKVTKRYGGFMKRYGGFMSRRSPPPESTLEGPRNQDEEESLRLEILKILSTVASHDGEEHVEGGEAVKRYGGFMRRAEEGGLQSDLLEAVLGRGLKKRYGGFMRRVGRPEWLVDNSKTEAVLKRAWENGSELHKRYGGFMD